MSLAGLLILIAILVAISSAYAHHHYAHRRGPPRHGAPHHARARPVAGPRHTRKRTHADAPKRAIAS